MLHALTKPTSTVADDAKQRSLRSLFIGAIATTLTAVLTVAIPAIQEGVDKVDWANLGSAGLTAALVALGSFVMGKVIPALNDSSGDDDDVPGEPNGGTPASDFDVEDFYRDVI